MIIKKIKKIIEENRKYHKENIRIQKDNFLQMKELEWAHIYHDSIRGKKWLQDLSLNIGRWAGNYTFFYVLYRVLNDSKPLSILEFGLGESSKFISFFLENELVNSKHLIIEQDLDWFKKFEKKFQLSIRSKVAICTLYKRNIMNYEINSYTGLKETVNQKFDVYIVDGPFGSEHFSRYDIVELAKGFSAYDEFIILIDDYQRKGEKEMVRELIKTIESRGIKIYNAIYEGNKCVCVLGTEKYKYLQSL